jgi:hypothetical protein
VWSARTNSSTSPVALSDAAASGLSGLVCGVMQPVSWAPLGCSTSRQPRPMAPCRTREASCNG